MKLSRAPYFADVVLTDALHDVQRGCYVDVGVFDPVVDSISFAFYKEGWRGVHVEPIADAAARLRKARPEDDVIQAAVGLSTGHSRFYSIAETGRGTTQAESAEAYRKAGRSVAEIDVQSITLADVLDRFEGRDVHWLKIDVQGAENDVFKSWQPSKVRPWIVVVKQTGLMPSDVSDAGWLSALLSLGYEFAFRDEMTWFFVSNRKLELKRRLPQETKSQQPSPSEQSSYMGFPGKSVTAQATETVSLATPPDLKSAPTSGLAEFSGALVTEIGGLGSDRLLGMLEQRDAEIRKQMRTIDSLRSIVQHRDNEIKRTKLAGDQLNSELRAATSELETNKHLVLNRTQYIHLLHSSTSWRMTAPLRKASHVSAHLRRGVWAWVSLRPGSRPHRVARRFGIIRGDSKTTVIAPPPAHVLSLDQSTQPPRSDPPVHVLSWDRSAQMPRSDAPAVYLFVDHTVGCEVNTGIQRTVRGLASGLLKQRQVYFVKWDPSLQACILIDAAERAHLARWNGPAAGERDRSTYLPADHAPIVMHPRPSDWVMVPEATCITGRSHPVTLDLIRWARESRTKIGFVFYDAIPLRRPELASSVPAQKAYMRALQYADAVWSISSWSAADLMAFWSAENVVRKPLVFLVPLPGAFDPIRQYEDVTTENLILSVGTIEPRKNQLALVRAFQAHRANNPDSDWKLVLVGNLHPLVAAEINRATQTDRAIRYAGHAPEDELLSLYTRCAFTVFPSVEEGFGLPILESLWYGKPCLCADFGSMAEVASGGGCLTCDTRSDAALSEALNRLIAEPELRSELAQQAQQRRIMSWSDYADSIMKTAWPLGQIYFLAQATAEWERNTGIQRVVRQLGHALLALGLDVIPVKLAADGCSVVPMTSVEIDRLAAFDGPPRNQWQGWLPTEKASANSWFVMPELPLHLSPQNHSSLIASLRSDKISSAAIFYDAIPWKMTGVYPKHYGQAHGRYMDALAQYDVVAPTCLYTENDLLSFLKTSQTGPYRARINAVILPGEFSESARALTASAPSTEGPIKIISVGTIEPRKNHETLLQAFVDAAAKSSRPLYLTLVGSSVSIDPSVPDRVRSFISRHPSITWEEHADDERLKELHEACDFTVYPSIEEGFGLPILESLWYGKPVICANFGSMAEVAAGGGCVTVDVRDAGMLAAAICMLADEPRSLEHLSREAVGRPVRTWEDYARDFVEELGLAECSALTASPDMADRKRDLGLGVVAGPSVHPRSVTPIYFLVESTAAYEQNTGIQRVVRQLARLLMKKGFDVVPVRWDASERMLKGISSEGLRNLAAFNGPKVEDWADWRNPDQMQGGWFMLSEVQQHWKTADHIHLIETMRAHGIRMAAVFYDAIPVKMSELYPDWLVHAHCRYMIELGFYDLIFPISQFSASDLELFLKERGFSSSDLKRLVKPMSLPGEFPNTNRVLKPQSIEPSQPLRLLAVGTVEPRKNHDALVRAFLLAGELSDRPLELTIVGNTNAVDSELAGRVRSLIADHSNISWLERVGDSQLAEWYEWSDLTVYPSIEEGFGLPILESLWRGKPVLCASFGAMAEAAEGGGCLTVDVRNVDAFADAIRRLADDTELLGRLSRKAVVRPVRSWDDYAEEMASMLSNNRRRTDNRRTDSDEVVHAVL